MLAWADAHPVSDPNALEQVLHLWSRSGLNEQLWSLLRMHQQRQNNHLRRSEPAGTWRTRGSGSGDRREDGAEAGETFYGDAPGRPQRGSGGGGTQYWGSGYDTVSRPEAGTPPESTPGCGRAYGSHEGPSGFEGPAPTRRLLD